MRLLRLIAAELLALVFPGRCSACGQVVSPIDGGLCPQCMMQTLGLLDQSYCNKCGQNVGPFALKPTGQPGVAVCGLCDERLYRYDGLIRVGAYADPLGGMVRRFKYASRQHLAGVLGRWQADRLSAQPWICGIDGFVPVPMHWRRRLRRGFNQSELLAECVASRFDRPMLAALSRPVSRPPQASLPRSKRFENVRGVFSVRKRGVVRGRRLCLIDDVCTTGATLSEAARTLLAAGAEQVFAAVVAVAQPPPAYSAMMNDPM